LIRTFLLYSSTHTLILHSSLMNISIALKPYNDLLFMMAHVHISILALKLVPLLMLPNYMDIALSIPIIHLPSD
jgi:hypothetical protein